MHVNMGVAFASLGQIFEALEHVNRSFLFTDGSADARALAGSLSLQVGDIASAEDHFHRALELRPGWKDVEDDLDRIRQLQ
jgi:Flp pilus assembly protein TadD